MFGKSANDLFSNQELNAKYYFHLSDLLLLWAWVWECEWIPLDEMWSEHAAECKNDAKNLELQQPGMPGAKILVPKVCNCYFKNMYTLISNKWVRS